MKKLINAIIIFIMCLFISAQASDIPENISVHDYAGVLSPATEKYIDLKNKELSEKCGAKIIFLTQNTTGELSLNEYAETVFDGWNIGSIGRSNSVFVLMSPEKEDYTIIVSEGISGALTDAYAQECLVNYMESDFDKENYDVAAVKTYNAFASWYNDNYKNVSLSLTDDLSEYEAMVDSEEKEAHRKTVSAALAVIISVILILTVTMYVRRQLRLRRLRKKRLERRKQYLKIRQKIH